MYSTRLFHLLVVAFSVLTLAHASWFDVRSLGFIGKAKHEIVGRQNTSTTPSATATARTTTTRSTSSAAPTTTSDTPTTTRQTTTAAPTTSTPAPDTTTSVGQSPTPTTSQDAPTTSDQTTSPGSPTTTPASNTPKPSTIVTTIVTTDSAGVTQTLESSAVVTPTGSLAQSDSSSNGGMSDTTKNTIIGVCAGVGGAIVLGAAGFLFWRMRRRRSQGDEDLVNYGAGTSQFNSGPAEKPSEASGSVSGRSPFQSTLESYHAPTQSNTGTNF